MERLICIYDVVEKVTYDFSSLKEAAKFFNVETSRIGRLLKRESEHFLDRFILRERMDILTTLVDCQTDEKFEILNIRTLGMMLNFIPTKRDSAALILLKGHRAFSATIGERKFFNLNGDKIKIQAFLDKWWHSKDKEKLKSYRAKTFQKQRVAKAKWNLENKEKVRIYNNAYTTARRKRDVSFRIRMNLRSRIKMALNGETKRGSIISLIGCPMDFLKTYIQNQFDASMNWENYGEVWTIDHIIPCSFFDLSIEDHQRMCCYYKNLRPLCKIENGKKLNHLPNDYRSFISDNLIETALYPVTAYKLMLAGHANL